MSAKAIAKKQSPISSQNPVWGDDPAYSVADAAGFIGIPTKTLYAHISARRLPSIKLVGKVMVRLSALRNFVNQGAQEAI